MLRQLLYGQIFAMVDVGISWKEAEGLLSFLPVMSYILRASRRWSGSVSVSIMFLSASFVAGF